MVSIQKFMINADEDMYYDACVIPIPYYAQNLEKSSGYLSYACILIVHSEGKQGATL